VIQEALRRIRAEFLEMPGSKLTAAQLQRLCGIDAVTCEAVLNALVDSKFLMHAEDGLYMRPTLDTVGRPAPLKSAGADRAMVPLRRRPA